MPCPACPAPSPAEPASPAPEACAWEDVMRFWERLPRAQREELLGGRSGPDGPARAEWQPVRPGARPGDDRVHETFAVFERVLDSVEREQEKQKEMLNALY